MLVFNDSCSKFLRFGHCEPLSSDSCLSGISSLFFKQSLFLTPPDVPGLSYFWVPRGLISTGQSLLTGPLAHLYRFLCLFGCMCVCVQLSMLCSFSVVSLDLYFQSTGFNQVFVLSYLYLFSVTMRKLFFIIHSSHYVTHSIVLELLSQTPMRSSLGQSIICVYSWSDISVSQSTMFESFLDFLSPSARPFSVVMFH